MDSLLEFVKHEKNVELSQITFEMIDAKMLTKFLNHLEQQGNCVTTRNLRLNSIKSFYSYAAAMNAEVVVHSAAIAKVPCAKTPKVRQVDYLSETAVKTLLEQPNPLVPKGLRDFFFLLLMYDTGARIQEVLGLRINDITRGKMVSASLHGKGDKIRTVPLMESTALHLENYLRHFHPNQSKYSDAHLFYTVQHNHISPLSDSAARKLVRQYGDKAKSICIEIPDIVHPHLLRHSRAMHLYQHGMDLTLIQQWLGHSHLETTYIYAYADTEQKCKAMEVSISKDGPLSVRRNPARFTLNDDETIKKLYGLM